jgi:hypothetical protein
MKIAKIAPLTYTPGKLEYFQFIRGGVGADNHQGPAFNQLSNHGLIQLDDGRILLGISHYRAVRPMTSDLDMAIFDEQWLMNKTI